MTAKGDHSVPFGASQSFLALRGAWTSHPPPVLDTAASITSRYTSCFYFWCLCTTAHDILYLPSGKLSMFVRGRFHKFYAACTRFDFHSSPRGKELGNYHLDCGPIPSSSCKGHAVWFWTSGSTKTIAWWGRRRRWRREHAHGGRAFVLNTDVSDRFFQDTGCYFEPRRYCAAGGIYPSRGDEPLKPRSKILKSFKDSVLKTPGDSNTRVQVCGSTKIFLKSYYKISTMLPASGPKSGSQSLLTRIEWSL
ncbi:hypothetical protein B0H13DRAFT_2283713 [Mycena leptocephala]|nr:hypothetical protein B0H13DRAFT_2283713 [Mycena leptocephala]